jgi:integrase
MLDASRAALPDSKTGPRAIWLGKAALEIISAQPLTCAFVFAVLDKPVSPTRLAKVWALIREEIGLPRLRIHDLRHGFASVAISSGEALRTVPNGLRCIWSARLQVPLPKRFRNRRRWWPRFWRNDYRSLSLPPNTG